MLLNEFLREHRKVQEQQQEIDFLKAELRAQRDLIQKVSAKGRDEQNCGLRSQDRSINTRVVAVLVPGIEPPDQAFAAANAPNFVFSIESALSR